MVHTMIRGRPLRMGITNMVNNQGETYLGDAVYVSFDGFGIRLRCAAPNERDVIILEPEVLLAFNEYCAKVYSIKPSTMAENVEE